jgi:hypothetical protein
MGFVIIKDMDNTVTAVKKKAKRRLTVKQRRFIDNYLQTSNATQAVIDAGYKVKSRNVARAVGSEVLTQPAVIETIEEILNRQGLSIPSVVGKLERVIDSGLKAEAKSSDALKGIEMAFKLHGLLNKHVVTENRTLKVSLKAKDTKELSRALDGKTYEPVEL